MRVVKRDGSLESVSSDKIVARIKALSTDLPHVDAIALAQPVVTGLYDGVKTTELDTLAAETAVFMSTTHPEYETLAARLAVSNLHKETKPTFFEAASLLYKEELLAEDVWTLVVAHASEIDGHIVMARDYEYSYFGFRTLCQSYLLKEKESKRIIERPQYMLMRVSLGIHKADLDAAFQTYDYMSRRIFTHASPTLFNAGTPQPQCSSCFLLTMQDDSIDGIYRTLHQCALISKGAGGVGLNVGTIRASGSYIKGTNGTSNGLMPMLRVYNATARYVDQGGGKRKGAFAIYIEPWHADIFNVLDLKKNTGPDELRARDLFYALWIPDLFMQRVRDNGPWSLMCPAECPGLCDVYGPEFVALYTQYEQQQGKVRKTVRAQDLWHAILEVQIESGTPYMLFKDACNAKSNQKNLGTIRGSNLCTEVVQFTSPDEVAVCNLASVSLPAFVVDKGEGPYFDHDALFTVIGTMVRNLNRVIEINHYPVPQARASNMRHRPIGLGVQGLADTFFKMRFPFESNSAGWLNREIFETIYFAACTASCQLARELGPYETYQGSPASEGLLQYDFWPNGTRHNSGRWDWAALKADISLYGLRNSLLVAPMPTASTSQILGNNECIEPITSNVYSRGTLAGSFVTINRYLVQDLEERGLWTSEMKNAIVAANGSVQGLSIPNDIKALYKTVWEIRQRVVVDMAADRAPYIDQSQSLNIHMAEPTFDKVTSLHFHAWSKGLKTGMYYLRTRPAVDPIKVTVNVPVKEREKEEKEKEDVQGPVCTMDQGCVSCGS